MSAKAAQITSLSTIYPVVYSGADEIKHQSSALSGLFWGESTGDRRIPLTKGQQRGKCFHLLTSPWQLPYRIPLITFTSEIIEQIIHGGDKPLRPHQPALEEEQPAGVMALVERCWEEDPQKRPDFSEIRARVRDFNKGKYVLRIWVFVSFVEFFSISLPSQSHSDWEKP